MVQMELTPLLAPSLHVPRPGKVSVSSSGHSDRLGDEPNHKDPVRAYLDQDPDLTNKNTHPLAVVMAVTLVRYVTQTRQIRLCL